jgi:bacillopeptidase F
MWGSFAEECLRLQGRTTMRQCRLICSLAFILVATGVIASGATAGQIDPGLAAKMQATNPDSFLSVVIRPIGTLLGADLKRQVTARYATRAEQHRATMEALQATATYTQRPVLAAINSPQFQGRVLDAEGFWIDNIITAQVTPSAIAELAQRADVEEILLMPRVELVKPIPSDATGVNDSKSVQNGLRAIRADSAWALGYTGSGRLVASLDTGVDGKHQMLSGKWRGHNGYPREQCWFDPVYRDTVPRNYPGEGISHGTNVMGIMVGGGIPGLNDTIGVCPDCQWISAAAIDIPCPLAPTSICSNLIEALQWVADPDGNPLTSDDVPDAVANPWGALTVDIDTQNNCFETGVGCADIFWNMIDNIEAAGAVMVFAAGNEGDCGASTIRNPANRVTSDVNAFSVGMVDTQTDIDNPTVDLLSSLGPSDCDGTSIKPELVAPGVNIRTTNPNNQLTNSAYGTSFSTPHVAAAVALLREACPNATVDQIKHAMISSARDLGPAGPDNSYGHGLLNVVGAIRALQQIAPNTRPNLIVSKTYYVLPGPGQTVDLALLLKNSGTAATGVHATLVSNDPRLTVVDGSASFPDMPALGDTANNSNDLFRVTVGPDVVSGERLAVTLTITAAGGYSRTEHAAIQTGPEQTPDLYTHDAGNVALTISDFGGFGLQADNLNPRKGDAGYGVGFRYPKDDLTPSLFEGAFMVGVGPTQVSDAARNSSGAPDVDFRVDPGGRIQVSAPGERYAQETRSAFSDDYAENPIGLFIEQRTWASDVSNENNYVVCEYTIHNRSGHTLTGVHAGLFFDWDFPFAGDAVASRDSGNYNPQFRVGWMRDAQAARYRGLAVISPEGPSAYRYFDNSFELYTPWSECDTCDGFTDPEKWAAMNSGFTKTTPVAARDGAHLIAAGPFTIPADSAVRVAFAIIGATSQEELLTAAQTAQSNYNAGTVTISPSSVAFTAPVGGPDPNPQSLRINNATDVDVTFGAHEIPAFLSVDPDTGVVAPGAFTDLTLHAAVGDRAAGVYRDTLLLLTSDPLAPAVRIEITLTVGSGTQANVNPNPFDPAAASKTVTLSLKKAATGKTTARIYDLGGELVKDFGTIDAGVSTLIWDGKTDAHVVVANGVYFCYVEASGTDGFNQTFKIAVKKN